MPADDSHHAPPEPVDDGEAPAPTPGRSRFEWLYLANSMVVIGISVYSVSLALARLLVTSNPPGIDESIGRAISLIVLPYSVATLVLQYCASFRRNAFTATLLARMLVVPHAFLVLLSGALICSEEVRVPGLAFLALGFYGLGCGGATYWWTHGLRRGTVNHDNQRQAGAARPWRFQFTLRELFGWMTILASLMSLTTWHARSFREGDGRYHCRGHLTDIGFTLRNYSDAKRVSRFPAYIRDRQANRCSWRMYMLPYCSMMYLYEQYRRDEPWDSPKNRKLWPARPHELYSCRIDACGSEKYYTSYVAVTEPGADGVPEISFIVEVADSGIMWTEPRDFTQQEWQELLRKKKNPSLHAGGYHVLRLNKTFDPKTGRLQLNPRVEFVKVE